MTTTLRDVLGSSIRGTRHPSFVQVSPSKVHPAMYGNLCYSLGGTCTLEKFLRNRTAGFV
eukprot:394880-Hanusia_phi.AAC.1